ncbi:hypothetical protein [Methanotorris formicicus]|uniref:Uncharacterized protein n=2 Tax=Methanotorris formicicus TaxID=213185 RepID=H1L0C2_9EURY|nr:hypothetical protein [Methanotorris formicicus]EHP84992.1 hypothetical protein MetfoDRAFT_1496 [Methanotorris formicicus Mc-S-70]
MKNTLNKENIGIKEIYYIEHKNAIHYNKNYTKECLNLWIFKKDMESTIGIISGRYLVKNEITYSCKINIYMASKNELNENKIFKTTTNTVEEIIKTYNLLDSKHHAIEYTYKISKLSNIYVPEICRANEAIRNINPCLSNILEKTKDIIQYELFSGFNDGPYFAYISEYRYDSGNRPKVTIALEKNIKIPTSEFDKFKENMDKMTKVIKKPIFLWDFIKDIDNRIMETHKKWIQK